MNENRRHWFITVILAISFAFAPIASAICLGGVSSSMEMSDDSTCSDMEDRKGCKCDRDEMDLAKCKQMCAAVIFHTIAHGDVLSPFHPQRAAPVKTDDSFSISILLEPEPPKLSVTF